MKRKLWYLSQNQNKEKLSQIILKNQAILTQASFTLKVKEMKPASKGLLGTSTVVEWLRIHLPMQGTLVRSPVGELRSHLPWQLSLYASTTEIAGHNEKKNLCTATGAHAPQWRSLHAAAKIWCSQKRISSLKNRSFKQFFKTMKYYC